MLQQGNIYHEMKTHVNEFLKNMQNSPSDTNSVFNMLAPLLEIHMTSGSYIK